LLSLGNYLHYFKKRVKNLYCIDKKRGFQKDKGKDYPIEMAVRSMSNKPEASLRVNGCVIVPTGDREKIAR